MIVQFKENSAKEYFREFPVLYNHIRQFITNDKADYILAVNQTPPTNHEDFFMRPHVDRRWHDNQFAADAPLWTTVLFLDFPAKAKGAELIVFENMDAQLIQKLETVERKHARNYLQDFNYKTVTPVPGRLYKFSGHLPHAVFGYESEQNDIWRLSIILAEFSFQL